jgi:pilus assembly protein Flp/PilA
MFLGCSVARPFLQSTAAFRRQQNDNLHCAKHGVMQTLKAFLSDESGATAIEYSLIAGGIALAIIATVKGIGPKLNSTFSSISTQLK